MSRRFPCRLATAIFALTTCAVTPGASAFAAGPGRSHATEPAGVAPAATGPLTKHGNAVQRHPKVFLVFWGPQWDSDVTHYTVKSAADATFRSLAGGQYNNILSQ